ncbi:16S rRNA (uracil(1498)-N(3))-methyltransferase [Amycolatopsis cihanbeyliensis]|uniref:Ribosomal RNA small subunit methyltransferase E n=1 Tax=Amycolatopsis cihanbeyliensis TaxID=1128664 RepID=A0A542CTL7_AMYCI|nr:16S rRNA (uracil(1498)-N(3))-methyltransferase [Amycolatopsis cihanbeyliensis]TQI94134.1 16S rRNA (uracil1498-N3)-methyltransferase [Amycolatopsis cihanbeyliensis]
MPDSTSPVFLVDELPAGERTTLTGEEARHAATVRRTRAGERLALSDGVGGIAYCVVEAVRAGREAELELRVERRAVRAAPALRVTVAQALIKGDRGELAVELATEAGVDALLPWRAARCVARWDEGARGAKALARWRGTARSAAKQSRRARVPEVGEPVDTRALAASVRRMTCALVLDAGAPHSLADLRLPESGDLLVIVGPEGGIAPEETELLVDAGAERARLGPSVLRASTAAAVTLGALGARTTRWEYTEGTLE